MEDLQQASARLPENEEMLRSIGWTLFNLQEYPHALNFWLRSGEISRYSESWHNYTVALGYWGVHDLAKAAYYYDRAVAQEKDFGTWEALQKRVDFWTNPERQAIYEIFDAWRRGYKSEN